MQTKKLLILAGGLGLRLRSVVNSRPKSLAMVGGRPFLSMMLTQWVKTGIKSFVFLLGYGSNDILEYIRSEEDGILKNCDWSYVVESEPLGTGGAIANAIWEQEILGDFLVTNSDTWFDGDLLPLINENYQSVGLIFEEKVGRYGLVNINSSNVITAFDEKSPIQVGGLVNLGFYNLNASSFNRIKKKKFSLEYELFPELINEGLLKGIKLKGRFIDIGIPESYFHMNQFARDNNF